MIAGGPQSWKFDDGLDRSSAGIGECGELIGDVVEGQTIGNPDIGVDLAIGNKADDLSKIGRQRVTACKEGEFPAVKHRGMRKRKGFGCDTDVNHPAGEGSVFEAG